MIENYMARPIKEIKKYRKCETCIGSGVVPLNPYDLDDERTTECPDCDHGVEEVVERI